jgi:hypothetical protein
MSPEATDPEARRRSRARVAAGSMLQGASRAVVLASGILLAAYLTRHLSVADYGTYAVAILVVSWVGAGLGTATTAGSIRLLAAHADGRRFAVTMLHAAGGAGLLASLVMMLVAPFVAGLFESPDFAWLLRIVALELPLGATAAVYSGVLTGEGRFAPGAAGWAAGALSRLALAVLLVELGLGVTGAALSIPLAALVHAVYGRVMSGVPVFSREGVGLVRLWEQTRLLAGASFALRISQRMDLMAVRLFSGSAVAAGYYAGAQNLALGPLLRSYQDLGGVAVNIDRRLGAGQLTATTAWRYWDWKPSNDRDFVGLPITTVSAAPSYQTQWSQEVRFAGVVSPRVNYVVGTFFFGQDLESDPTFRQEQGAAAARYLLAPSAAAATPGLLDGYGYDQYMKYTNISSAGFGQVQWSVTDRLRILPGLRLNFDHKEVDFNQTIYGGLQTTDPVLVALQRSVLAPQAYTADVDNTNVSGQLTVAYKAASRVNTYATYATSFKSVGLNLNGLPTDAAGNPVLSAATVKPEDVRHVEVGVKTEPARGVTANVTFYNTAVHDFQAQVVNASVGVLRGYLANAAQVRVRGLEFDGSVAVSRRVSFYGAAAFTDGRYVSFPDAPPPVEDTGGPQVKDISGSLLPGISKVAVSFGGEVVHPAALLGRGGELFAAFDASYRSRFSSSPSESAYQFIEGYSLLNTRVGFRAADGWTLSLWARNLLDSNYFDLLTAAPGNTGLIVGQPGDPRTVGVTLRVNLRR